MKEISKTVPLPRKSSAVLYDRVRVRVKVRVRMRVRVRVIRVRVSDIFAIGTKHSEPIRG